MRKRLHEIIFEADTPAGKTFDVALLVAILASILVVAMESVDLVRSQYAPLLRALEWFFTILFTIEYIARIYSVRRPKNYIFSFFGVVDLVSILPTYLAILLPGAHGFSVVRALRLLRVFRVFKLAHFLGEAEVLGAALRASLRKITVFLVTVVILVLLLGTLMYTIESPESGFSSIPHSIYWAVVTLTTVGYGDVAPQTPLGKMLASIVMILGYGILAVPTGIVSVELARQTPARVTTRACPSCGNQGHDLDARFCKFCGDPL
ncbi:MAG: ion transporter [Thermoanaerobaculia bacterium]|nr:ion transporter [Thermoanaerobaculia bacterium]